MAIPNNDVIADEQIRELRMRLFASTADAVQLHGLVDCHAALGWSHRRKAARARCAALINAGR